MKSGESPPLAKSKFMGITVCGISIALNQCFPPQLLAGLCFYK